MNLPVSESAAARLRELAAAHARPLLFASLSGADLYGFPSPDSDYDLRGVHVLPLAEVLGLDLGPDTIEQHGRDPGFELDLVTHDVAKFVRMLLKPNGYVLEQLYSPLVVCTTPAHAELQALARGCITRQHVRHYEGFAHNQWRLLHSETPPRVKPLLYVFRVLLTGIHLLRTGEVVADLSQLDASARLPDVADLIARKRAGTEAGTLSAEECATHAATYERLCAELQTAAAQSPLPDEPRAHAGLHDFSLRVRLGK